MKTHNPDNERIKRAYFTYLVEAQGFSEATLDGVAKAINRFETYTKFRDFKAFHIEQAKGFKASLAEQMSLRTKDRLSKATLYATLNALKRFFIWLAGQPGYKSRISYSDAEYFNLSAKETRVAKARREERVPTLEQIRHLICMMPANTEIERRDRALVAFTILTGARDRATASIKLKHVDLDQGRIDPGCASGEHQVLQDIHDVVLPRRRRHPADRRRLGQLFAAGKALGRATIHCFRQRRSWSELVAISRFPVSTASTGAAPVPSARFSRMRSQVPVCPISIRTAFGRRSLSWARSFAALRSNSRPGARTSATRRCLRRFRAMVRSPPSGSAKSFASWRNQWTLILNSRKF